MVKLKFIDGKTATLADQEWRNAPPEMADFLASFLDRRGPSPSDPDPDLTVAQAVTRATGAKIVAHKPPAIRAGSVY